jgi:hypothetical protein
MRAPSVFVRDLLPDAGNRLKRLSRKAASEAKRERALICWASAMKMSAPQIAALVGTDESHVRKVIQAFNERGFSSLGDARPATQRPPDYETKAARVIALYKQAPSDGTDQPAPARRQRMGQTQSAPSASARRSTAATAPARSSPPTTCMPTACASGCAHDDAAATTSRSCVRSAAATPSDCGSTGSRTTSAPTRPPTSAPTPRTTTSSSSPHRPTPAI